MATVLEPPPSRVGSAILAGDAEPTLSSNDVLYEVVNKEVRELSPMGARETRLASVLFRILSSFAWEHGLGHVDSEMLYLLDPGTGLQRRPDLAFVSFDRWPRERSVPQRAAWEVTPNLAIEVVSPNNFANEIVAKIEDYFLAGVQRVWVIYPEVLKVYDYSSPTFVQILTADQSLEGGAILPGWQIRLSEIFEPRTGPA
jgi:Uma2 family endonuclease